jgi:hypothetical protein
MVCCKNYKWNYVIQLCCLAWNLKIMKIFIIDWIVELLYLWISGYPSSHSMRRIWHSVCVTYTIVCLRAEAIKWVEIAAPQLAINKYSLTQAKQSILFNTSSMQILKTNHIVENNNANVKAENTLTQRAPERCNGLTIDAVWTRRLKSTYIHCTAHIVKQSNDATHYCLKFQNYLDSNVN